VAEAGAVAADGRRATRAETAAVGAAGASEATQRRPETGRGPWATRGACRPTAKTKRAGQPTAAAAAAAARGGTPESGTWPPTCCARRSDGLPREARNSESRTRTRGGRRWPRTTGASSAAAASGGQWLAAVRGTGCSTATTRGRRPSGDVTAAVV